MNGARREAIMLGAMGEGCMAGWEGGRRERRVWMRSIREVRSVSRAPTWSIAGSAFQLAFQPSVQLRFRLQIRCVGLG